MNLTNVRRTFCNRKFPILVAILSSTALSVSSSALWAQQAPAPAQSQVVTTTTNAPAQAPAPKIPNDQLDSLVAPIALYPDPLVAQVLAASTYPLEIVQLEQWMKNNKSLKGKALSDAVAKQTWDPSVQSLAAFPDVLKQLSEHVSWTMDLGNAFLAQQSDVMDAVQRMRAKAQGNGNLKTSAQQKVETQTVDSKQVIVIEPADPEVIYVPQYSPTVVYGASAYPYPYTYPPGYGMLAFGAGIALGAAWGGSWGNCDWHGGGDVTINNNNNFNRNNVNNGNRNQAGNRPGQGGGGKWNHNPSHRGGAPYGDRGTADKFGGRARQQPAGGAGNRPGGGGAGNLGGGQGPAGANRPGGGAGNMAGNRPGGGAGAGNLGGANRPGGGAGAGNVSGANRPSGGAGVSSRPAGGSSFSGGSGGGDRIGNRGVSSGGGFGSSSSAFGGGGYSGSSARSASSRGGSSMGGGGFSGGGGRGGGGGGRGGGGGGGGRGGGGGGRRR